MSTTTKFGSYHSLWLLRPVLNPPCLRLEILYLKSKIGHSLCRVCLICKDQSVLRLVGIDQAVLVIYRHDDLPTASRNKYPQSCTLGNSSISIGEGPSSIVISVTSLVCCWIGQKKSACYITFPAISKLPTMPDCPSVKGATATAVVWQTHHDESDRPTKAGRIVAEKCHKRDTVICLSTSLA